LLSERDGALLTVSSDPMEKSAEVVKRNNLAFPLLADDQLEAITRFGVLHKDGRPVGGDIAIPSHFLFNKAGELVWQDISGRTKDRPTPATLVATIRQYGN
jgi:peroxiredoxin